MYICHKSVHISRIFHYYIRHLWYLEMLLKLKMYWTKNCVHYWESEICAEVKPPRVHTGTTSLYFWKNLNNSCLFASESDLLCLLANYELPATCPYTPKFTSIFPYFQTCCLWILCHHIWCQGSAVSSDGFSELVLEKQREREFTLFFCEHSTNELFFQC